MFELTRKEVIDIAPIIIASLVAIVGWGFTYFHKWHFEKKANQLERVSKQLKELYGPLYITLRTAHETWESFVNKYFPKHGQNFYFAKGFEVTEEEKKRWCIWMKNVFEPLHKKIEIIVLDNADLFENGEIPDSILMALAHANAYKAVLAQWASGDYSEYLSVNGWPSGELMSAIEPQYKQLVNKQQKLLGA